MSGLRTLLSMRLSRPTAPDATRAGSRPTLPSLPARQHLSYAHKVPSSEPITHYDLEPWLAMGCALSAGLSQEHPEDSTPGRAAASFSPPPAGVEGAQVNVRMKRDSLEGDKDALRVEWSTPRVM